MIYGTHGANESSAPAAVGTTICIAADNLPGHGQPLAGGTFVGRYELNGQLHALVLLPQEIEGEWGPGEDAVGASSSFDGQMNTLAMAAAGSALALEALKLGGHIPSPMEGQILMAAQAQGWADLREGQEYWLSTQSSPDSAELMGFAFGWKGASAKDIIHLARLVRSIPIR